LQFGERNDAINMKLVKKLVVFLGFLFLIIKFIQPAHNKSGQVLAADFRNIYKPPANVVGVLQSTCYDCHSNNTSYPWYSKIQPVAWLMANQIKNGKKKLSFGDFGSISARKQISKLKEIATQIKADEMPLASYKWIHKKANLTKEQKVLIMDWMNKTADSLSAIN
jgi:hypothetical protein